MEKQKDEQLIHSLIKKHSNFFIDDYEKIEDIAKEYHSIKSAEHTKEIESLERDNKAISSLLETLYKKDKADLLIEQAKEIEELKEINSNQRENLVQLQLNYGNVKAELNKLKECL